VGSGAAALNAAVQLSRFNIPDIAIVTEKTGAGTSANAGSDKQTYYRLNPTSKSSDSILEMAQDLFSGCCMHGDIALVEAALSQRAFFNLVEIGVPFPQNKFGEYIGFQTDHDTKGRGTSAGPKTSILMFEKLLQETQNRNVTFLDQCSVIDLLTIEQENQSQIAGLLAIDKSGLLVIKADFVVYGTGGPGALYYDSVYPKSQLGSLGIALRAGVKAQNLTESQFGIASTQFRWNLSGSYQQVLPCYISTEQDGSDPNEFLSDYFPTLNTLLEAQFLKGYQWPFDVAKLKNFGSSLIDLAVYHETNEKGRKVYLDFRQNPGSEAFSFNALPQLVKEYLLNSNATSETPVQRLKEMNYPAYELYKENGIDLEKQTLEIAVCHQHCNGGLAGSIWWESSVRNFFPIGECNGSHGLYRPGGSSLNSGQVGAVRAAELICFRTKNKEVRSESSSIEQLDDIIEKKLKRLNSLTSREIVVDLHGDREQIQRRMSESMGIVRSSDKIRDALEKNLEMQEMYSRSGVSTIENVIPLLKNEDLLITEQAFLESALLLAQHLKGGRGSYLFGNVKKHISELTENIPDHSLDSQIIEFRFNRSGKAFTELVPVRPIPSPDNWFEKVWRDFREGRIYQS